MSEKVDVPATDNKKDSKSPNLSDGGGSSNQKEGSNSKNATKGAARDTTNKRRAPRRKYNKANKTSSEGGKPMEESASDKEADPAKEAASVKEGGTEASVGSKKQRKGPNFKNRSRKSLRQRLKDGDVELTLHYFNIPGKGEPIRLALSYAGIPFVDNRVDADRFKALKAEGKVNFDQLPCLEVRNPKMSQVTYLAQSASILRFVGRDLAAQKLIYPDDPFRSAYVDSILDQEIDLFTGLAVSRYRGRYGFESIGNPGDKLFDTIRKDLNDNVIPRHLGLLERRLSSNNPNCKWFANTKQPSIADFCLVPRLGWLAAHGEGISEDILKPFPLICGLMEAFYDLPQIKEYYETHPFAV